MGTMMARIWRQARSVSDHCGVFCDSMPMVSCGCMPNDMRALERRVVVVPTSAQVISCH